MLANHIELPSEAPDEEEDGGCCGADMLVDNSAYDQYCFNRYEDNCGADNFKSNRRKRDLPWS